MSLQGRACARTALDRIGSVDAEVPRNPDGSPTWPDGVVGSITHTRGFAASAVAWRTDAMAIGIDAEPHLPLRDGVLGKIAGDTERRGILSLSWSHPDTHWDRILFSAKESVYKAWSPMTGLGLRFRDVTVTVSPEGGFAARFVDDIAVPSLPRELEGRWSRSPVILTAIRVPPMG